MRTGIFYYVAWLIVLLLGILSSVQAQKAFTVQLNIDTTGINTQNLKGTFALHASVRDYPYSSAFKDTLWQKLSVLPKQYIAIPAVNTHHYGFHLVFTPEDTLLPTRKHLFQRYLCRNDTLTIDLNSYFLNQSPPSFFANMKEKDTLVLYSRYSGMSHEMMLIPSYCLSIVKDGDAYQAFYDTGASYSHEVQLYTISQGSRSSIGGHSPTADSIQLYKKHLEVIQKMEANLWKRIYFDEDVGHHFPPNYSYISSAQKKLYFRATGHIGLELWRELLAVKKN